VEEKELALGGDPLNLTWLVMVDCVHTRVQNVRPGTIIRNKSDLKLWREIRTRFE